MAFREVDNFDAPIAGMSLTHELGARAWQTPPELATLDEAIGFYIPRLSDKNFANKALDIIESGVPITSLAEVLTLGGVMEGLHTIDVAVLINPILVEFLEGMAKITDTKYTLGDVDGEEIPDRLLLNKAMQELKEEEDTFEDIKEERKNEPIEEEEEQEEKPKGLMARKGEQDEL
tara:strand:- start:2593 stop:3120 length:528 start_codon:yes stop_codon:yes gene_type:complete